METRFKKGQKVRSTVNAQGMLVGEEFEVLDVYKTSYGFLGTVVNYRLRGAGGRELTVGNGPFVLAEVRS